ncbi:hypothetical protein GCM10009087_02780 [Sphingomonas oligophenolica]
MAAGVNLKLDSSIVSGRAWLQSGLCALPDAATSKAGASKGIMKGRICFSCPVVRAWFPPIADRFIGNGRI